MLCSCSCQFLCNLETGSASHEKSSVAVSILGTWRSATVCYFNLGWVWGSVWAMSGAVFWGRKLYMDIYIYIWILYGKWHQSGLCFGLWFGERSTIWILYGQSWQNWAFKQAVAWNKLVSQIITSFVSLWRYGPGVLKGPPHLCRTCNYSQLLDVA